MHDVDKHINEIKNELKAHNRLMNVLDKKTSLLEKSYEYQHETLDKIEKQINDIAENLSTIRQTFSEHNGASAAKSKIHNNIYLWLSFIALLITNDIFWNYWKN
jgi:septal ring factor EnvC (AmiA/AmiB activator)